LVNKNAVQFGYGSDPILRQVPANVITVSIICWIYFANDNKYGVHSLPWFLTAPYPTVIESVKNPAAKENTGIVVNWQVGNVYYDFP